MNSYEMTAKIVDVGPVEAIGKNGFKKRTIILCEDPEAQYPKFLAWELKKDKCGLVTKADKGKTAKVWGFPECRAWKKEGASRTSYFVSFTALKVEINGVDPNAEADAAEAGDDPMPF